MDSQTSYSNITPGIISKWNKNLHNTKNHPLCIIKELIYNHLNTFTRCDTLNSIVSTKDNFDLLLIDEKHPSRSKADTYYVTESTVLRTHTSAHQNELLKYGLTQFLVTGDVYRKDEINKTHYPIFHQMEGVCIVEDNQDPKEELLKTLVGLVNYLFPDCEYRVKDDYFPFTNPSFEIEVKYNEEWLEILGCGVIQPKILEYNNITKTGWAFGLGLERLAMILFKIPDIRLFWSSDTKFLDQFSSGTIVEYKPFSKLPPITKDISFWIDKPDTIINPALCINDVTSDLSLNNPNLFVWTHINSFYDVIREVSDDIIENVELNDKFYHPKKQNLSHTFRITFSPVYELTNGSEFNRLANEAMEKIRTIVVEKFNIVLR